MKVGVYAGNEMPWPNPESLLGISTKAEELGFHSVWLADHIVLPVGYQSPYPYTDSPTMAEESETFYEPLITLAYLASATKSIRLGTSVLVAPLRNPVHIGKQVATLDRLSGGRVILGVGVGWLREEFEAVGSTNFQHRGQSLDESIGIWRALWTQDVASFEGTIYRLPKVRSAPKPIQPFGPPIWIGGNGTQAIKRAACLADGWHPISVSAAELADGVALIKEEARRAGRPASDIEIWPRLEVGVGIYPETRQRAGIYAPADKVLTALNAYRDAGATGIVMDPAPFDSFTGRMANLERFAIEVLPSL